MRFNDSTPSGLKTGDTLIFSGPGQVHGIDVVAPTSSVNYLTVYDSEDSSTSSKIEVAFVEADAGMVSINHEFFTPVTCNRGCYIKITGNGTDCRYIVRYAKG